jgi:dynein light intermediate chain 1
MPAGWDSWSMIVVLCDDFDAKAWGEAWERDLSSDAGTDSESDDGTQKLYASLVQDQGPKVCTTQLFFHFPQRVKHAANPTSTSQLPDV